MINKNLTNKDIAQFLIEIADFLEINAENPYRIRAYRRAARKIETFPEEIMQLLKNKSDLTEIPYVGKAISIMIKEFIRTRRKPLMQIPYESKLFNELKHIPGLGIKRIRVLNKNLIFTKKDLLTAISTKKLQYLPGFNQNLVQKILDNIDKRKYHQKFLRWNVVDKIVTYIVNQLKNDSSIKNIVVAGDYRRKLEYLSTLDIIVLSSDCKQTKEFFLKMHIITDILEQTSEYCSAMISAGSKLDLYLVSQKDEFPYLLLNKTGSKSHIESLTRIAHDKKIILTEKQMIKNKKIIYCSNENSIYEYLNMQYIPPELRENRGEVALSLKKKLPQLVVISDIKGDLHSHTHETDGSDSLVSMVNAAIQLGYQYLAITDHTKSLYITHGLNEERLMKQIKEIDKLNEKLNNFTILKSSEVDILEDGSLDLPDYILKELDLRVCSIHSKFNLPEKTQTERIIKAMDNPYFNILGHPTGRLIPSRKPYLLDMLKIMEAAKEKNCILEINAQPARLDLNDIYCQMAKKIGVKFSISSDAHSISGLNLMIYGINQARRGWVEAKEVINTYSLNDLKKLINRK